MIISSDLVVGVADPVSFFGDSFVFAVNQFLDAAVVWASMIKVDLGEELRIRGKGGCSSTSKALGLKNPIAGLWSFSSTDTEAAKRDRVGSFPGNPFHGTISLSLSKVPGS